MESTKTKKKWLTMLLTAMMSITLLFGATACNDNNAGNDIIVEDEPDIVVPDADPEPDVDLDVDVETPSPSPSAS